MVDQLTAYEDHILHLEKEREDRLGAEREQRRRIERKNRDSYKVLLLDMQKAGRITLKTKWNDVYPLVRDDPRLLALLVQPGSTPLDLFRDQVDDLEDQAHREKKIVKEIFRDMGFTVTPETTYEEFTNGLGASQRLADIDAVFRQYIYDSVGAHKLGFFFLLPFHHQLHLFMLMLCS